MARGSLRVILLWHMHQPFYKDLATGEYRLPWVRMHGLKDYYGMVKLLDEFPQVHQTFNLVPSLVQQLQDYARGSFRDPFYDVIARPASDLSEDEKRFALRYLFQAHTDRMIGRYPRYRDIYDKVRSVGPDPTRAELLLSAKDYADLQVLSQVAWFDEFFLEDPEVKVLVEKGRGFNAEDQRFVLRKEHEILNAVLPAYASAANRGLIEISATPYYHPILPLICDTNVGAESSPGLPLPRDRYQYEEDADEQISRALDAHEGVFGVRPKGMWPSEGSVSSRAIEIAASNNVKWMATDEGVLGRSLGLNFARNDQGGFSDEMAASLYNIYQYEYGDTQMKMVFRDHRLSDLIGFAYAGMSAKDAAEHLISNLKSAAAPVTSSGSDAVVSIILDGENAWETYDHSGREFLRRFYDMLQSDPQIEPVTVSEAIERQNPQSFGRLANVVPGSWINANFNVWIGAPEDNRAWEYLASARSFYTQNADKVTEDRRKLAYEELLIAEGSDWNWWYGPEHHSANDRDFDELYRKHLSNVYQALGAIPPEHLARPIAGGVVKPTLVPQTAYIHPRINGRGAAYFDWMGSAMYTSDRSTGSMHGKEFLLETIHAGIDEEFLYGRLDLATTVPSGDWQIIVQFAVIGHDDSSKNGGAPQQKYYRLEAQVQGRELKTWICTEEGKRSPLASTALVGKAETALAKVFEFRLPLEALCAQQGTSINLRFSAFRDHVPLDALPLEGSIDLPVESEDWFYANSYQSQ